MRDAVAVEKAGKPVVALITEEFVTHAKTIARVEGHADLKRLVLPYPMENRPEPELRQIAETFYPRMLEVLGVSA